MLEVIVEQAEGDIFECPGDCGDLSEDVDAVAVLVDHPIDAADLAFEAPQTIAVLRLIADVPVDGRVAVASCGAGVEVGFGGGFRWWES